MCMIMSFSFLSADIMVVLAIMCGGTHIFTNHPHPPRLHTSSTYHNGGGGGGGVCVCERVVCVYFGYQTLSL